MSLVLEYNPIYQICAEENMNIIDKKIIRRLKLDKSLEKELIYTLNTDYEKIEKLCQVIFKNRNCLENESDIIRLAVIVGCLKKTKEYYKRLNISEDIFYDTMTDVRIWCENNNNKGLQNYRWLTTHINAEIFKIGRLQFQLFCCDDELLDYSRLPFEQGENVIYIHIPQGERLIYTDCIESIAMAKGFFKLHFPDYKYKYFFCESWLLYQNNSEFMQPDSNIIKFANLFDIAYSNYDDKQAIERIFGKRKQNINDYPENTSLQIAAKKYLKNKNKLGMGIGTISI